MDSRDQEIWDGICDDEEDFGEVVQQLVAGGAAEIAEDLERRMWDAMSAVEMSTMNQGMRSRPSAEG